MGFVSLVAMTLFAAIAGLVFAVVAAIVMAITKSATPLRRKLWIGLPALIGLIPAIIVFAPVMAASVYSSIRPASWAYEEVFGTPPAAQSALKAATSAGFDSRRIYLSVDRTAAASEQISQHVADQSSISASDMADSIAVAGDAPDWWRAGRPWLKEKSCADVVQTHYIDVGDWANLIIADCPSQKRIFVLALR
jgi:isocitrate lyase